ncbi:hypothetical protein AB0M02_20735 [Actinoplanes sp. NPDC051861]|uniref:hypothetical protein n=1 Tax=Actinoplanes sp. NPDC051861 TaxID=3155170 RepID=UPI003418F211
MKVSPLSRIRIRVGGVHVVGREYVARTGGEFGLATRDTRRQFEEIVGRLAAEDPFFSNPGRRIPGRATLVVLAVAGAVVWGGLSVLMVIWGAVGVLITCVTVAAAIITGVLMTRRR